jgi:hypothetical protein
VEVLGGAELYFRSQDEYPGAADRRWFRSFAAIFGAAVYPLNQYFLGVSVEPKRGFMIGAGYIIGSQPSLSSANYVGQSLGPATTAPSVATNSAFKSGAFLTIGFDSNIFQAIFKTQLGNVGTPAPSPGSGGGGGATPPGH